jgi:uncharacterized membrane protein YphA (DoxX/SURF4 family)
MNKLPWNFMMKAGLAGAFIVIAGAGAGAYSLDALLGKRRPRIASDPLSA